MPEHEISDTLTQVLTKFVEREKLGVNKYGTTVDREDLTPAEWVNHHEEELMDAILYNRRMFHELLAENKAADMLIQKIELRVRDTVFEKGMSHKELQNLLFQHKLDATHYKFKRDL